MSFLAWPAANSMPGTARTCLTPCARKLVEAVVDHRIGELEIAVFDRHVEALRARRSARTANSPTASWLRLPWPHSSDARTGGRLEDLVDHLCLLETELPEKLVSTSLTSSRLGFRVRLTGACHPLSAALSGCQRNRVGGQDVLAARCECGWKDHCADSALAQLVSRHSGRRACRAGGVCSLFFIDARGRRPTAGGTRIASSWRRRGRGHGGARVSAQGGCGLATGSIALYSDALESVGQVTAIVALVAVSARGAAARCRPALRLHGGKAECSSAVVIGVFIAPGGPDDHAKAWTGRHRARRFAPIRSACGVSAAGDGDQRDMGLAADPIGAREARLSLRRTASILLPTWYRRRAC